MPRPVNSLIYSMPLKAKVLSTLALAVVAFLGNMLNLPLFFGLHFIFGSIAVMLAVKLLGLWPALCVSLAGGAYTWVLWGHPYAMLPLTLEALTVSLLYRRGVQNLVLADLAFWLLATPILVPLLYIDVIGMDTSSASLIALKQSLNGVFNALIAGTLIKAMVWRLQDGSVAWLPADIRLNELLFHVLLVLTLVAGATPVIIGSYADKIEQEQVLAGQLKQVLNATAESFQRQPGISPIVKSERLQHAISADVSAIALLNGQGKPVAQAGESDAFSTANVQPLRGVDNLGVRLPETGGSLVNRWKAGHYQYRLPVTGLADGTALVAESPAAPLIETVEHQRNRSFAFLAGMTLLSILVSYVLSRFLTRPLVQLDNASKHMPEKIRLQRQPELPDSKVHEYAALSASLQTMSDTLADTFAELDSAQANLELDVKARTRELADTTAMLNNVLEASTKLAIIATDTEGTITLFNTGAENLLGYDSSEIVGIHSPTLFHLPSEITERSREFSETTGEDISGFDVLVKCPLREGSETREWSYVNKQGVPVPVMLTVTPIRDVADQITGFLSIAQDITERKRVEQMKNEFISTVSHELRTPLTSVSGAIGLVLGGRLGDIPEKAHKLLKTAHRNSERLAYLINELLDIEKIAAGKLHFDLKVQPILPLLEQAVEENKTYSAERNVKLVLNSELARSSVRVDEQRLKQVLANLLSNAIKFSPDGGTVTLGATHTDAGVVVGVTDQGPGIPEDFHQRIFQKFAQADSSDTRQKGGTGLGLAITRELVERMGGTIDFETTRGKGTHFFFTLPSVQSDRAGPTTVSPDAHQSVQAPPRILIVEDDTDVAALLKIMLEGVGYRVGVCHTGIEALEALGAGDYNLITLDLMLPDINGLDIIRRLKQQGDTANIPIVVVSARVNQGRLVLKGEADNIAWLPKPIEHQKLIDLVQHQLSAGDRPRILHVEDDADLHDVISAMVSDQLILERAGTIASARALLKTNVYGAVLLDIGLPDGSGWELIPSIEQEQSQAPIIILSGEDMPTQQHETVKAVLLKNHLTTEQLVSVIQSRIRGSQPSAPTS